MSIELNTTTVLVFVTGQLIASIVGGVALYVAIRVDLARKDAHIEALRDRDTLILDRADDAHQRIDDLYARVARSKSTT